MGISISFRRALNKHLVLVNALQTGALMVTGDLLAQTAIEKRKKINFVRTFHFFITGTTFVGPAMSLWYKCLTKYVGRTGQKNVAIKKVLLDQLIFAPLGLGGCMVVINAIEGRNWVEIKKELNLKYFNILTTNYCVWPFVQFVNFYFVPLKHQVLFVQTVAVLWNTYLCLKIEQGKEE